MKNFHHSLLAFFRQAFKLFLLCLCMFSPFKGIAQFGSMTYNIYDHTNVKYYTAEYIPSPGWRNVLVGNLPGSAMLAGSVYNSNMGRWLPHFMYVNRSDCFAMREFPIAHCSETYYDSNFEDERLVGFVSDSLDTLETAAYVVISAREDPSVHAFAQDKIKILKNRGYTGNGMGLGVIPCYVFPSDQIVIKDNSPIPPGRPWGNSLYPINCALKRTTDPNTGQFARVLYVCGYATFENTLMPDFPDFYSNKKAFIIAVNVTDPANMTVIASRYFDYTPNSTQNALEVDFDVAMKVIPLTMGPNANNIFLTGSVTAKTGTGNGPPSVTTFIRSATMNFMLDHWTLNPITSDHFVSTGTAGGDGDGEYGIAMQEANNGLDHYIISNRYDDKSSGGWNEQLGRRIPVWNPATNYNTRGFNTMASYLYVTHANPAFMAVNPSAQRLRFQINGWGLTSMLSSSSSASTKISKKTMVIGGMLHGNLPACSHLHTINDGNITPFLWDIDVDFSNPTSVIGQVGYYNTAANPGLRSYPINAGTGNPAAFPNTYVGFGDSNPFILWGPTMASRSKYEDYIIMANPHWLLKDPVEGTATIYNRLTLKGSYINKSTLDMNTGAGCYVDRCHPTPVTGTIQGIGSVNFATTSNVVVTQPSNTVSSNDGIFCSQIAYLFAYIGGCYSTYAGGTPYYKMPINEDERFKSSIYNDQPILTGVTKNNGDAKVYPNPANAYVKVQLPSDIKDAHVNIYIQNLVGQTIATIYNGSSNNLKPEVPLALPAISSGIYLVYVYADNKLVTKQKLTVRQ